VELVLETMVDHQHYYSSMDYHHQVNVVLPTYGPYSLEDQVLAYVDAALPKDLRNEVVMTRTRSMVDAAGLAAECYYYCYYYFETRGVKEEQEVGQT